MRTGNARDVKDFGVYKMMDNKKIIKKCLKSWSYGDCVNTVIIECVDLKDDDFKKQLQVKCDESMVFVNEAVSGSIAEHTYGVEVALLKKLIEGFK